MAELIFQIIIIGLQRLAIFFRKLSDRFMQMSLKMAIKYAQIALQQASGTEERDYLVTTINEMRRSLKDIQKDEKAV